MRFEQDFPGAKAIFLERNYRSTKTILEAAHEIIRGTAAIRNLIREDKVAQMYSAIQTGASLGMQTMDQCLADLVARRIISREAAKGKAKFPENF